MAGSDLDLCEDRLCTPDPERGQEVRGRRRQARGDSVRHGQEYGPTLRSNEPGNYLKDQTTAQEREDR